LKQLGSLKHDHHEIRGGGLQGRIGEEEEGEEQKEEEGGRGCNFHLK
jgi:hypothetical protein